MCVLPTDIVQGVSETIATSPHSVWAPFIGLSCEQRKCRQKRRRCICMSCAGWRDRTERERRFHCKEAPGFRSGPRGEICDYGNLGARSFYSSFVSMSSDLPSAAMDSLRFPPSSHPTLAAESIRAFLLLPLHPGPYTPSHHSSTYAHWGITRT